MTFAPRQQALTLVCEIRSDAREALLAELASQKEPLAEAFRSLGALHFARFLLVPAPSAEELLFELGFDGPLAPALTALWTIAGGQLARVFRYCNDAELPGDAASFARFCGRHARRADAAYAAHDGLSVALIRNDTALDRLLQRELDRAVEAETIRDHGPLEIAMALQARARVVHGDFLCTQARAGQESRDPLEPIRRRFVDVLLALAVLPLLELWHSLRGLFRAPQPPPSAGADSSLLREQGPVAHLVYLKTGSLRLRLLKLTLWLVHGWLGQRGRQGQALSHLHNARWLVLPGPRLLFLAHTELGPGALLSGRSAWERRLTCLIWLQAEGFPFGLRFALRADRREAALRDWVRSALLPSAFWYSAYPGLSIAEIERNHRVRELLGRNLDRERAGELCALL